MTSIAAARKKTFLQPSSGSWRQGNYLLAMVAYFLYPGSEKLGCYALMLLLIAQPNLHDTHFIPRIYCYMSNIRPSVPLSSARKHFPSDALLTHSLTVFQYLLKVTFSKILSLATLINWSCFLLSASLSTNHQSVYNLLQFFVTCFSV